MLIVVVLYWRGRTLVPHQRYITNKKNLRSVEPPPQGDLTIHAVREMGNASSGHCIRSPFSELSEQWPFNKGAKPFAGEHYLWRIAWCTVLSHSGIHRLTDHRIIIRTYDWQLSSMLREREAFRHITDISSAHNSSTHHIKRENIFLFVPLLPIHY